MENLNLNEVQPLVKEQSVDDLLEQMGGCGKYQIRWFIIVVMGMVSGAFILYSIYYLELPQVYSCTIFDPTSQSYKIDSCN